MILSNEDRESRVPGPYIYSYCNTELMTYLLISNKGTSGFTQSFLQNIEYIYIGTSFKNVCRVNTRTFQCQSPMDCELEVNNDNIF